MRYLSVCSGIEAASVAFGPHGWEPVAFSEIDRAASALLAHHYQSVPNWGDMSKFKDWPDADIDVLCGGTPCQDYSVAGLRAGMAGARGSLTLTFVGIAGRYRPRWLAWENVPGVLSSNGGRDFARFLGDLSGRSIGVPPGGWQNSGIIPGIADAYGVAYRVLDAQHVRTRRFPRAVPQRRRRVFVVGYLGDWRRAAAVLFDRESLSGNPPPRREAGKGIAAATADRSRDGGGPICANSGEIGYCLTASAQQSLDAETETLIAEPVAHALRGEGFDASEDGTGRGTPLVPVAIQERAVSENPDAGPQGAGFRDDGAAYTLEARHHVQAVAFSSKDYGGDAEIDLSPTLRAGTHDGSHANAGVPPAISTPWAVRRLTPRECERLMGFPDDYTLVPLPLKGRQTRVRWAADGPRYKQLGNSWAINCVDWIAERITEVDKWAAAPEKQEQANG